MKQKYPLARGLKEMGDWGHIPNKYSPNGETRCIRSDCGAKIRCEDWNVVFSNFRKKCPAKYD